jgi:hypothetical protein
MVWLYQTAIIHGTRGMFEAELAPVMFDQQGIVLGLEGETSCQSILTCQSILSGMHNLGNVVCA